MIDWRLIPRNKGRKYPLEKDEFGQSLRKRAFDLFREKYRPAQVSKTLPISMKTACRYFEDWKKITRKVPYSHIKELMKKNTEFSEKVLGILVDYFDVPREQIILRMQRPWGLMRLLKGELPNKKLLKAQSVIERRLEAALRLIVFAELLNKKSPETVKKELNRIIFSRSTGNSEQSPKGELSADEA